MEKPSLSHSVAASHCCSETLLQDLFVEIDDVRSNMQGRISHFQMEMDEARELGKPTNRINDRHRLGIRSQKVDLDRMNHAMDLVKRYDQRKTCDLCAGVRKVEEGP